jgi:hypothetical protein
MVWPDGYDCWYGEETMTQRASDWPGDLSVFLNDYKFQPDLTKVLDAVDGLPLDQAMVNEIVLWKVDRYARISPEALSALNALSELGPSLHRMGQLALTLLMRERGIDLPMASTLLRFRNPKVFQIIDRHAYRAVYGQDYRPPSNVEEKIDLYFRYLDTLIELAQARRIAFRDMDRILYVFDKKRNGALAH